MEEQQQVNLSKFDLSKYARTRIKSAEERYWKILCQYNEQNRQVANLVSSMTLCCNCQTNYPYALIVLSCAGEHLFCYKCLVNNMKYETNRNNVITKYIISCEICQKQFNNLTPQLEILKFESNRYYQIRSILANTFKIEIPGTMTQIDSVNNNYLCQNEYAYNISCQFCNLHRFDTYTNYQHHLRECAITKFPCQKCKKPASNGKIHCAEHSRPTIAVSATSAKKLLRSAKKKKLSKYSILNRKIIL